MQEFVLLGLALTLGLLVGVERGWQGRGDAEGSRVAGVRTFGLIGLLGGLSALLAQVTAPELLGISFAAFGILVTAAHFINVREQRGYGITTAIAALVTFVLGVLVMHDRVVIASAAAVVMTLILSMKPVLHAWLKKIEPDELAAVLKFLLISVVLLPILPNENYGPWQVLNPRQIWWFVVLISAISFSGYIAMKLAGQIRGILLTSFLGGLVSSTAVTMTLARLASEKKEPFNQLLAAGILVSCATMFPRVLIEVLVVNRDLISLLWLPLSAMSLITVAGAISLVKQPVKPVITEQPAFTNPFQLLPAIKFGFILVGILLLSEALKHWFGSGGILLASGIAAISDVDAITLSLARMAKDYDNGELLAFAIVEAAVINTLVKAGIVAFIGGWSLARKVLVVLILGATVGLALALI